MFSCCRSAHTQPDLIFVSPTQIRTPLASTQIDQKTIKQLLVSEVIGLGNPSRLGYKIIVNSNYQEQLEICKMTNKQFTDKQFPPDQKSLGKSTVNRRITWKRIPEIISNPLLIDEKIETSDILQGKVGDCYFLATIASLADNPSTISHIFDDNLKLSEFGIYKLVVNWKGQLRQVVLDDYIPVYADNPKKVVYCKPNGGRQVWVMLVQKIWAKICGSYGNTSIGYPHEVFNTFTLAPCLYHSIPFDFSDTFAKSVWKLLAEAHQNKFPTVAGSRQKHTCKGIQPGHAYSLLGAYEVSRFGQKFKIIKLRNPWGWSEYVEEFSQNDKQFWNHVDIAVRNEIFGQPRELQSRIQNGNGFNQKGAFKAIDRMIKLDDNVDDGVFTIELAEFIRNFEMLDIAHIHPSFNYLPIEIELPSSMPAFYQFTVGSNSKFYLTIEKPFTYKSEMIKKKQPVHTGMLRMLLGRRKQQNENHLSEGKFIWVGAVRESIFPDVTLKIVDAKAGTYVLYIESITSDKHIESCTLSVYSKDSLNLKPCPKQTKTQFLEHIFFSHAESAPNKKTVGSSKDWVCNNYLYEECGIGYVCANLSNQCEKKIAINYDTPSIEKEGFKIINIKQKKYNRQIEQGQGQIILFQKLDLQSNKEIQFPPKPLNFQLIT